MTRITSPNTLASMTPSGPGPWPEGVVARLVTAAGLAFQDPTLTVDLSHQRPGLHSYRCHGCGTYRDYISGVERACVKVAQEHATTCTGLPRPEAGER